jgi:TolB-like protein
VASLRRLLDDDPKRPAYIATVPRMGYRMVATVSPWVDAPTKVASAPQVARHTASRAMKLRAVALLAAGGTLGLALLAGTLLQGWTSGDRTTSVAAGAASAKSIAVLPFRDMTPTMDQEILADDLTEDLIDKLSRVPGLRASPPGSSFSLKGQKVTAPEAAKILGVGFVLDGSVRKSGATVRMVVRLVRADDGLVVWSQTYDGPAAETSRVVDDIAGRVGKAMMVSVEGATGSPQTTRSR